MKICEICEKSFVTTLKRKRYCYECAKELKRNSVLVSQRIYAKSKQRRFSGKVYENSHEKIQAIKEKYKNGIPNGTIESMIKEKFL